MPDMPTPAVAATAFPDPPPSPAPALTRVAVTRIGSRRAIDAAAEICRLSWRERYPDFMPARIARAESAAAIRRWFRRQIRLPGTILLMARIGTTPAGIALVRRRPAGVELAQLFVLPAWQGRGAGHALLQAARRIAAVRQGFLWADVARGNHRARAWYEARGAIACRNLGLRWGRFTLPMIQYRWHRDTGAGRSALPVPSAP